MTGASCPWLHPRFQGMEPPGIPGRFKVVDVDQPNSREMATNMAFKDTVVPPPSGGSSHRRCSPHVGYLVEGLPAGLRVDPPHHPHWPR